MLTILDAYLVRAVCNDNRQTNKSDKLEPTEWWRIQLDRKEKNWKYTNTSFYSDIIFMHWSNSYITQTRYDDFRDVIDITHARIQKTIAQVFTYVNQILLVTDNNIITISVVKIPWINLRVNPIITKISEYTQ